MCTTALINVAVILLEDKDGESQRDTKKGKREKERDRYHTTA